MALIPFFKTGNVTLFHKAHGSKRLARRVSRWPQQDGQHAQLENAARRWSKRDRQ